MSDLHDWLRDHRFFKRRKTEVGNPYERFTAEKAKLGVVEQLQQDVAKLKTANSSITTELRIINGASREERSAHYDLGTRIAKLERFNKTMTDILHLVMVGSGILVLLGIGAVIANLSH